MAPSTKTIQDVFAAVVPDDLQSAADEDIIGPLEREALRVTMRQYAGRPPRVIAFNALNWLITTNPDDVERFQPAHDCAACRAGNDQAVAFLREHPHTKIALANLTYTEVWP